MDSTTYYNLKLDFEKLTNKKADDNLDAFFSYVNMINLFDIKKRMEDLRQRIDNIEKKL